MQRSASRRKTCREALLERSRPRSSAEVEMSESRWRAARATERSCANEVDASTGYEGVKPSCEFAALPSPAHLAPWHPRRPARVLQQLCSTALSTSACSVKVRSACISAATSFSLIQPPVRLFLADPRSLVVYLLGTAIPASSSERTPAIIKIEKTPYDPQEVVGLTSPIAWEKLETVRCPA